MPKLRALSLAILVSACCAAPALAIANDPATPSAAASSASGPATAVSSAASSAAVGSCRACGSAKAASPASAASACAPGLCAVPLATIVFVAAFFIGGVLMSVRALKQKQHWLIDALSEKNPSKPAGTGTKTATDGTAGADGGSTSATTQPTTGSTSRLIAFLGGLGMLALYMGLGVYALWALFNGCTSEVKDAMAAVSHYLLYGTAMYAPYAVNQAKAAFAS